MSAYHRELREPRHIVGVHEVGMLDAQPPISRAVCAFHLLIGIEDQVHGIRAQRVAHELIAALIERHHQRRVVAAEYTRAAAAGRCLRR